MGWLETTLNGLATQIKSKLSKNEANEIFQKKEDAFSGQYRDLKSKPKLATVAISGDWTDVKNKPDVLQHVLSFSGGIEYPTSTFRSTEKKWAIARSSTTMKGVCPLYCFTKENGLYMWDYLGQVSLIKNPPEGIENLEIQKLYVFHYYDFVDSSWMACYMLAIKNSDQLFIAKDGDFYSSTLPSSANLMELLQIDNSLLAIPQESDVIFKSDDFGKTWSTVQFPRQISSNCYGLSYSASDFKAAVIFESDHSDFFYSNDLVNWETLSLPGTIIAAYYNSMLEGRKIILGNSEGYYFDVESKTVSTFTLPDSPKGIIQGTEFGWYSYCLNDSGPNYKIFRNTYSSLVGVSEEPTRTYYLGKKYVKIQDDSLWQTPRLSEQKAYHFNEDAGIVFEENLATVATTGSYEDLEDKKDFLYYENNFVTDTKQSFDYLVYLPWEKYWMGSRGSTLYKSKNARTWFPIRTFFNDIIGIQIDNKTSRALIQINSVGIDYLYISESKIETITVEESQHILFCCNGYYIGRNDSTDFIYFTPLKSGEISDSDWTVVENFPSEAFYANYLQKIIYVNSIGYISVGYKGVAISTDLITWEIIEIKYFSGPVMDIFYKATSQEIIICATSLWVSKNGKDWTRKLFFINQGSFGATGLSTPVQQICEYTYFPKNQTVAVSGVAYRTKSGQIVVGDKDNNLLFSVYSKFNTLCSGKEEVPLIVYGGGIGIDIMNYNILYGNDEYGTNVTSQVRGYDGILSSVALSGKYDDLLNKPNLTQKDYTLKITTSTPDDVAMRYTLTQESTGLNATIDIPKDKVVLSGEIIKDPEGQPTGTYLVLTLANAANDKIYINVADLIDTVTSGSSAEDAIQITVSDGFKVSASLTNGAITKEKLSTEVQNALDASALVIDYTTPAATDYTDAIAAFNTGRQVLLKNGQNSLPMTGYDDTHCYFGGSISAYLPGGYVNAVYAHIGPNGENYYWYGYKVAIEAAGLYSADAGDYFESTNVMGQLQELGEKIKELSANIPTKTSQLENDSGFVSDKDAVESEVVNIPSKLSEFENDVGYLTLDTLPQT